MGGVAPTAADDAQIPIAAGNMSVGAGAVCRSADFSTYTGQLSGTGTLTIGDGTAGASNIALKLVSGMTVPNLTVFSFISTSATVQTVDFAGKNTGSVSYNAASNGSWQLTGQHGTIAVNGNMTVTLTKGTLDSNGQTCFWGSFVNNSGSTRTLTCGASVITLVQTTPCFVQVTAGLTHNTNTSEWIISGLNAVINIAGTFNKVTITCAGAPSMSGSPTVATLTRTGTAAKTDTFVLNADLTVTSALVLSGNSSINRVLMQSDTTATARVITNTGATMTWGNVDIMDVTLSTAFDASAITGLSGNCGGNTNITFTTPTTQTWSGTTSANWSANAWTTRVPLPQDTAVINAAFSAGQTVTADMPRMGSVDWTGATGTPAWSFASTTNTIFGSITLIAGMTISGTNTLTLGGRSTYTLTSGGQQYTQAITQAAPSGTYTLADAFSTAGVFTLTHGTFNAAIFNVTGSTFVITGSTTRALTMGTGTWSSTSTGTATVWSLATTTGLTFSGASASIMITGASANVRTFAGGGLTYGTLTYVVAGSTGKLTVTGSNTFSAINFSDATNARTLEFTAGTTTIITTTNGFNVQGTNGKLMTIQSATASNHTLSSSKQQSCDYISVSRSTAQGGGVWYAGANSTDGGNNSGWLFSAAPAGAAVNQALLGAA